MKKTLYAMLVGSTLLSAQDPTHFKNITFTPHGCGTPTTTTTTDITVTGAGGSPTQDGYTFTLSNGQTAPLVMKGNPVTFKNIVTDPESENLHSLSIQDSSTAQPVSATLLFSDASSGPATIAIDSLPLGTEPGCITVSVINPTVSQVEFGAASGQLPLERSIIRQAPFRQTFSSFAVPFLTAAALMAGDCNDGVGSRFVATFPLPQGQGNAIRLYLYKKLCSCALRPGTIVVPQTPTA